MGDPWTYGVVGFCLGGILVAGLTLSTKFSFNKSSDLPLEGKIEELRMDVRDVLTHIVDLKAKVEDLETKVGK